MSLYHSEPTKKPNSRIILKIRFYSLDNIEGSVETKVACVTFFGFFSNFYGKKDPVTQPTHSNIDQLRR